MEDYSTSWKGHSFTLVVFSGIVAPWRAPVANEVYRHVFLCGARVAADDSNCSSNANNSKQDMHDLV